MVKNYHIIGNDHSFNITEPVSKYQGSTEMYILSNYGTFYKEIRKIKTLLCASVYLKTYFLVLSSSVLVSRLKYTMHYKCVTFYKFAATH
jgi:hypothetical protein